MTEDLSIKALALTFLKAREQWREEERQTEAARRLLASKMKTARRAMVKAEAALLKAMEEAETPDIRTGDTILRHRQGLYAKRPYVEVDEVMSID